MLILVTGSSGMLGREFVEQGKKRGHEMVGWTRRELDLEKPEEGIRRMKELKPGAVIHCAAETNVDLCEQEPERALKVNGETPGKLAAAARELGAQFVYISTSGIFGGEKEGPFSEEEPPRPGTAYARAKVLGEEKVKKEHPQALILRAGWLFGGPLEMKKNFVGARLQEAMGKEVIRSATDKRGSPTWTKDFAERALELLEKKTSGLVHLVNAGWATRHEYVAEILRLAGWKTRVEGVDSSAFVRSAPVPADEQLVSVRGGTLRSWEKALMDYIRLSNTSIFVSQNSTAAKRQNSIKSIFLKLFSKLSARRKCQLGGIFFLMIFGGLAEIVSLGMVVPLLMAAANPEQLLENLRLNGWVVSLEGWAGLGRTAVYFSTKNLPFVLAFGFALAVIVSTIIRAFLLWASTEFASRAGTDLSCEVYRRNLYQPYQAHTTSNSSALIAAVVGKIPMIVNTFSSWLTFLTSLVICLFIFVTLVVIDPKIAFIAFLSLGAAYFGVAWVNRREVLRNSSIQSKEQKQVVKALQEGLGAIRDVILDQSQTFYCNLYRSSETGLRQARAKAALLSAMPKIWVEAAALLLFATLVGFFSMQEGGILEALPSLGALALGAQRLLPSIQQGYSSWTYIQSARVSVADVLDMLELPVDSSIGGIASRPLIVSESIRFEKVKFRYAPSGPWVLDGLSFSIPKGARVGFVGKTGSGKSTCLDLLMGLLEPTEGAVFVDHNPLSRSNLQAWRRNIAHVPQSIFLMDSSFADNIAFGMASEKIDYARVEEAARKAQISGFIESTAKGYLTTVGERGIQLSGGQRQRIGIARALYKRAGVLVFDEATSALDQETEKKVMTSIEKLSSDLTILLIAHRTTTLSRCDLIIDLSNGECREHRNLG